MGPACRCTIFQVPIFFWSKDQGNLQSDRDIFASANFGLGPLHPHNVGGTPAVACSSMVSKATISPSLNCDAARFMVGSNLLPSMRWGGDKGLLRVTSSCGRTGRS